MATVTQDTSSPYGKYIPRGGDNEGHYGKYKVTHTHTHINLHTRARARTHTHTHSLDDGVMKTRER